MNNHFGLSNIELQKIRKFLSDYLKIKNRFSISVFGSRATGSFRQYSDLDLWIDAEPPLTRKEVSKLEDLFEESDLPIKVDIVTKQTCLPEYKERIAKEKMFWFS